MCEGTPGKTQVWAEVVMSSVTSYILAAFIVHYRTVRRKDKSVDVMFGHVNIQDCTHKSSQALVLSVLMVYR